MRDIVVSGAASGIGRSLAGLLTERGDRVIGVDLRDADVQADLSEPRGRDLAVRAILEATGGSVDGVVACAGVSGQNPLLVRVNHFGATALLEGLRPALVRSDAPRAAVIGSVTGARMVDEPLVRACLDDDETAAVTRAEEVVAERRGGLLYPSSKAALARWARTRAISGEWAGERIPLNVVAPGVVRTPMTRDLFEDERMREIMDEAVPMPLNGHAPPEAVAHLLRWLVGEENSHMAGQVVYVDGGAEATLRGPEVF